MATLVQAVRLADLVAHLGADEPPARDTAAADLADFLEAGQLNESEFQTAVNALIQAGLAECDPVAKESLFNALSSAATDPKGTVDWRPVADRLGELAPDSLEHALLIFGLSGDASFLPRIEPLLHHQDEDVRRDAAEAVKMLRGSVSKPRSKTGSR